MVQNLTVTHVNVNMTQNLTVTHVKVEFEHGTKSNCNSCKG